MDWALVIIFVIVLLVEAVRVDQLSRRVRALERAINAADAEPQQSREPFPLE